VALRRAVTDVKADPGMRATFDAGLAAYAAGEFRTAIDCFNQVIDERHDDADAYNNLGLSYLALNSYEDATDAFVLATHFRPQFPQAFYNMALAALGPGELEQAVTSLERALELQPDFAAAHNTLGYVLSHQLGEFEMGAAHIRKAMELNPADPDVLCNYSAILIQEGRAEDALTICHQLLAAHPAMHEARLNRALAGLKLGRFEEAWPDYEARKLARGNYVPRALPLPEWLGEPLLDRKLLVYAEQGIGDQIMFASCMPDVLMQVESCMIECASKLAALFIRSFPSATIVSEAKGDASLARLAQAAGLDGQVAIGSLPGQLRKRRADFPSHAGYLHAEPARIEYWKHRLDILGPGLKIGIAWSGGAPSTQRATRSTQLAEWLPILAQTACHFVSLQHGNVSGELAALSREQQIPIHDWPDAVENYDETAALVTALDLVISVQTALVHLAGALGKPAWVLLRAASEWRYLEHGETMPWYPGVRLFRQSRPGEWTLAVARVAQDLAQLARR
jgi:Flp pilus assembly protein TadD